MQDFATGKAAARGGAMPKLNCSGLLLKNYRHAVRIMKITAFILLAFCLQVAAKTKAQGNITLKEKGASIIKVMTEVQRQTGYDFLVTSETINRAKPVDIEVKDAPLSQVLEIVFKNQPLTYTIKDKLITIRLKADNKLSSSQPISPAGDPVTVSGKVTDENGQPLVGANVKVKGSNAGVTTDNQGRFTLNNVDPNATLEISFVGHETQLLSVKGKTVFTVALGQKVGTLDETVVIAYGTTSRRLSTGNVASVKASDIEKQPVYNPLLALVGRVPGMFITQSTGLPGSGVTVRIQGQNSIVKGNDPLIVIDGIPYPSQMLPTLTDILGKSGNTLTGAGNPLSFINPTDIESIDVLKDADATSIYGSRAANGAILITTKKGKVGQTKADINIRNGWGQISKSLNLLNTRQYLDMRYETLMNDGIDLSSLTPENSNFDLTVWDTTRHTNWQKKLIGGTANYFDLNGSLSGGNVNTQFLIGANFHKETTVFPGDLKDTRGSVHLNLNNISTNKKFRINVNGIYMIDNNKLIGTDLTAISLGLAPNAPELYYEDGTENWAQVNGASTWTNPVAFLHGKYNNKTTNLLSNSMISYEVFPGLSVRSSFGYTNLHSEEVSLFPLYMRAPESRIYSVRSSIFANSTINTWNIEPQINFQRSFGIGKLDFLVGTTILKSNSDRTQLDASGFTQDFTMEDPKSAPTISISSTLKSIYRYNALFGRLNYNIRDNYLVNITARRDGSSRFGSETQFHNFWSLGGAWIFSRESIIQKKLPFLTYGKLFINYGTTGSDQIGDYQFLNLYSNVYGTNLPYQGTVGLLPIGIPNPYLEWEETNKLSCGINFGLFSDKTLFTINYFRNRSSNQLLSYQLPVITGATGITRNFPATIQNSGWEFTLGITVLKSKTVEWTTDVNLTIPKNKLVEFPGIEKSSYANSLMVGKPIAGLVRGYHFLGVDPTTGLYQFMDKDGNPTSSASTSNYMANYIETAPVFYGGFENRIGYKNFSLDFLFQFVKIIAKDYSLGNPFPGYFSGEGNNGNQPISVLSRWHKSGDISSVQKFSANNWDVFDLFYSADNSNAVYSDASYIRLKNLSLSWQIPKTWKTKFKLQYCKLFIQGQNLLTITKFTGLDPETQSLSTLPPLRIITMGIQVGL